MFQHTAARRRLDETLSITAELRPVSTHSRPKAAGNGATRGLTLIGFQHTAARRRLALTAQQTADLVDVSTHSRPKAAGGKNNVTQKHVDVSTHSRPKAAGRYYWYN